MKKKIVLVSGSRILAAMIERVLSMEADLEIVQKFVSINDLSHYLDIGGTLDADEVLILRSKQDTNHISSKLQSLFPEIKVIQLRSNGSSIGINQFLHIPQVIERPDLPTLIGILKGEMHQGTRKKLTRLSPSIN